jgi:hypothetical protein
MKTARSEAIGLAPNIVSRQIGDSVVGLDTRSGQYFRLAGSAGEIWSQLADQPVMGNLVDVLAQRHDAAPSALAEDIAAFIDSAREAGLVMAVDPDATAAAGSPAPVRLERTRAVLSDPAGLREAFERQHFVHLPSLIEPSLLELIQGLVDAGSFFDRTHDGIGTELCLTPGVATSVLQLLFNDPALRSFMASVSDNAALGCFDGRVYRLSAKEGHYDSWHSDAGEDRRIAVSLNLSPDGYEGGELEIRRTSSDGAEWTVASSGYGSAVMFRIDSGLRHRVIAVRGAKPRTAWAGWFRTLPVFEDLFLPTLQP